MVLMPSLSVIVFKLWVSTDYTNLHGIKQMMGEDMKAAISKKKMERLF